jgi:hypothetical protein
MSDSLRRAAADECLRTVFGAAYGALTVRQGELLVSDLIGLDDDEQVRDLYEAARRLQSRVRPATLHSYAETLEAGAIREEAARVLRDLDTGPACAPVPHEPHDEYPYPSCPGFVGPEEARWSEEA